MASSAWKHTPRPLETMLTKRYQQAIAEVTPSAGGEDSRVKVVVALRLVIKNAQWRKGGEHHKFVAGRLMVGCKVK